MGYDSLQDSYLLKSFVKPLFDTEGIKNNNNYSVSCDGRETKWLGTTIAFAIIHDSFCCTTLRGTP